MTVLAQSQCFACKHRVSPLSLPEPQRYERGTFCAAFPEGIPGEILDDTLDHREPIAGDHGIQWESDGKPYPEPLT